MRYDKFVQAVDRMLTKFGKDCELIIQTDGEYNPATGDVEQTETIYQARAIEGAVELDYIKGSLVESTDRLGMLKITDPDYGGPVTLGMKIRLDGKVYTFRQVEAVSPGPVCLYWRFVTTG